MSLQINSDLSFVHRNKSLRSIKELKSISKELLYKKPQDLNYNTVFKSFDDSELMLRHRCSFVNSKLKADKSKYPSIIPGSSEALQNKSYDLVSTLGAPKPETIFQLSTNLEDLKKQVDLSQIELIQLTDINSQISPACRRRVGKLKPITRKDVNQLEEWLDFMLQELTKYPETLFENAQIVYSAAFQEILSQVKFHCLDRGNLLERVWKAYFSLMISAIKQYQSNSLSLKIKTSTNSKLLESKYKEKISSLESELNEKSLQLAQLQYSLDSLSKSLEKQKFNEKIQQTKFNVVLRKYQQDKVKLLRLEDTNNNLKHLISTVMDDIDSDMPGLKKMKGKNMIRFRNISEILISDPLLAAKRESYDMNFPIQELEKVVEQERVDLENKIFMHEIKEQMMDTEEEFVDQEVNTDLIVVRDCSSQTEFDDFCDKVVDVQTEEGMPRSSEYQEFLAQMLKSEEIPNDKRLNTYFNLDDVQGNSDGEQVKDESIELDPYLAEFNDPEIQLKVNEVLESVKKSFKKNQKVLKMRVNYFKIKKNMCLDRLKELRKMLFLVVNENLELKQKIRKGTNVGVRKIVRKPATRKKLTITKEFNLGKKKIVGQESENVADPVQSNANNLIDLVVSGKYKEQLSVSKKGMMRVLNGFIHDLVSQTEEMIRSISSPVFSFFSYVSGKFAVKSLAKANFAQYLLALMTYKQSSKTFKIFSRLFGLCESLDVDYFYTFVDLFKIIFSSCSNSQIITDSNEEIFISLAKCEEASELYWKGKILDTELQGLKKSLQQSSAVCPKNQNRTGIVNQIDFLEINLRVYVYYLEHSKHQVKDLFDAVDLDSDGFLDLEEFKLIFRNLEKKNFTTFYANMLFTSYSDIIAENKGIQYPAMSYSKFSLMSAEKGLFHSDAQELFIGVKNEEELKNELEKMFNSINHITANIEWKLIRLGENKSFLKNKLELVKEMVLKGVKKRFVYLAYRLIEQDTKDRLIGNEIEKFLPGIIQIHEKVKEFMAIDRSPPKRGAKNLVISEDNESDLF